MELRAAGWSAGTISGLISDLMAQDPAPAGTIRAAFGAEAPEMSSAAITATSGGVDVVIPCLNGRRSLLQTIRRVHGALPDARVILSDAGSTDGTLELVRAISGAGLPWLIAVLPSAGGYQPALLAGVTRASAGIILRQDLALNDLASGMASDPAALRAILTCVLKYDADVIFRTRWSYPVVPRSGEAWRRRMNANLFRVTSGLWLSDPAAGVAAVRREAIEKMMLTTAPRSLDLEIAWLAARRRLRVCEMPAAVIPDDSGDSVIRFTAALLHCALSSCGRKRSATLSVRPRRHRAS